MGAGTKTIRLEIEVSADTDERELLSRALTVATHRPAEKAITLADAFETAGITVTNVGTVEVGNQTPDSAYIFHLGARWYQTEIDSIAKSILGELRDEMRADGVTGQIDDDALYERVHETIDSHNWVTYTAKARLVIAMCDSPDAWEDEGMSGEPTYEQRAYFAMAHDVRAEIERIRSEYEDDSDDDSDSDDE